MTKAEKLTQTDDHCPECGQLVNITVNEVFCPHCFTTGRLHEFPYGRCPSCGRLGEIDTANRKWLTCNNGSCSLAGSIKEVDICAGKQENMTKDDLEREIVRIDNGKPGDDMTDEECKAKLVKILNNYENNPGLKASKTYYLDEFIALASKSREEGMALKPCPFCGSIENRFTGVRVTCDRCLASGPVSYISSIAQDQWNTRG